MSTAGRTAVMLGKSTTERIHLPLADHAGARSVAARPEVVISVDYEIYDFLGSNHVDIDAQMLAPTAELMRVSERHGARLSIMFEMGCYFLFRQEAPKLARQIEHQLQDALARGHDVQLHIHPHLLPQRGARYDARRKTVRFRKYRRIHEVLEDDPHFFANCKQTAERLLKPIVPEYEMVTFRAGKYQVQPHAPVYEALAAAGFLAASNVVRGRFLRRYGDWLGFDYRTAWTDCQPYFPSQANIGWPAIDGSGSLLELPICEHHGAVWSFDAMDGKSLAEVFDRRRTSCTPLVMLGHSKGPVAPKVAALDEALLRMADTRDVLFSTISETARRWFPRIQSQSQVTWAQAVDAHYLTPADVHDRLTKQERRLRGDTLSLIQSRLSRGRNCRVGIFGCGTGYSLLLPLADQMREGDRVSFHGYDSDAQAMAFGEDVARRWQLRNVHFGTPPAREVDVAVVQDLYKASAIRDTHVRAAAESLKPEGKLIRVGIGLGVDSAVKSAVTDLARAVCLRVPALAIGLNRTKRMIQRRRRRGSDRSAKPFLRYLQTSETAASLTPSSAAADDR